MFHFKFFPTARAKNNLKFIPSLHDDYFSKLEIDINLSSVWQALVEHSPSINQERTKRSLNQLDVCLMTVW